MVDNFIVCKDSRFHDLHGFLPLTSLDTSQHPEVFQACPACYKSVSEGMPLK